MIIKCKKSGRFLMTIDIDSYLKNLLEMGISQEIPLEIRIPCRSCKKVEVYHIYKNGYKYVSSFDKTKY